MVQDILRCHLMELKKNKEFQKNCISIKVADISDRDHAGKGSRLHSANIPRSPVDYVIFGIEDRVFGGSAWEYTTL
jgi:hypothetical protein